MLQLFLIYTGFTGDTLEALRLEEPQVIYECVFHDSSEWAIATELSDEFDVPMFTDKLPPLTTYHQCAELDQGIPMLMYNFLSSNSDPLYRERGIDALGADGSSRFECRNLHLQAWKSWAKADSQNAPTTFKAFQELCVLSNMHTFMTPHKGENQPYDFNKDETITNEATIKRWNSIEADLLVCKLGLTSAISMVRKLYSLLLLKII